MHLNSEPSPKYMSRKASSLASPGRVRRVLPCQRVNPRSLSIPITAQKKSSASRKRQTFRSQTSFRQLLDQEMRKKTRQPGRPTPRHGRNFLTRSGGLPQTSMTERSWSLTLSTLLRRLPAIMFVTRRVRPQSASLTLVKGTPW